MVESFTNNLEPERICWWSFTTTQTNQTPPPPEEPITTYQVRRYIREIFHVFTVTKLTDEGYFNNDFAIVSSAEDAF